MFIVIRDNNGFRQPADKCMTNFGYNNNIILSWSSMADSITRNLGIFMNYFYIFKNFKIFSSINIT